MVVVVVVAAMVADGEENTMTVTDSELTLAAGSVVTS